MKLLVRRKVMAETSAYSSSTGHQLRLAHLESLTRACWQVLWAVRLARPYLLRASNHLATKITKWTSTFDSMMQRLMGYIQATLHMRIIGCVGASKIPVCFPHFPAGADFAGNVETQQSASGYYSVRRGPNSSFPMTAGSKRQSYSTPEVGLVAADFGLRTDGLPSFSLWRVLFPHRPPLLFHEGNQAMIRIAATGKNPTMRYLGRTHRASVARLHEVCRIMEIRMVYEETRRMCADIFSQKSSPILSWRHACDLIQIIDPKSILALMRSLDLQPGGSERSSLESVRGWWRR